MVRKAKGKRPIYFNRPELDKLFAIVMALVGEVSVLRERLDTIERLVETKGILSIAELETYQPDEKADQEREKWRAEYIARILRTITDDT